MKFEKGDKARICSNVGETRNDFLKHCFEIGTEVEIAEFFNRWKGHEAYNIKINGRLSSEVLLAEELEPVIEKMKNKKTISMKLLIGIIIGTNALTLETIAILHFGNVYNIYTVIPLLMVFGSILLISNEYD